MKHTPRGFTLIELMVTVTMIAVLTVIGVVSYSSVNKRARDAKRKSDLEQIRSALEMYRADNGNYPCNPPPPAYVQGWVSGNYTSPRFSLKSVLEPDYMANVPLDPKVVTAADITRGYAANPAGGDFGYMYGPYLCTSSSRGYALWAQLESPSTGDNVNFGKGPVQYDSGTWEMNYKVLNP